MNNLLAYIEGKIVSYKTNYNLDPTFMTIGFDNMMKLLHEINSISYYSTLTGPTLQYIPDKITLYGIDLTIVIIGKNQMPDLLPSVTDAYRLFFKE
jgi:hypothetical protein